MTIEDVVAAVSSEVLGDVTPETQIGNLGLDSLDFLDLILHVSNRLDVTIPDSAVPRINTVYDLFLAAQGKL